MFQINIVCASVWLKDPFRVDPSVNRLAIILKQTFVNTHTHCTTQRRRFLHYRNFYRDAEYIGDDLRPEKTFGRSPTEGDFLRRRPRDLGKNEQIAIRNIGRAFPKRADALCLTGGVRRIYVEIYERWRCMFPRFRIVDVGEEARDAV